MQVQIGFELVLDSGSPTPTAASLEPPSYDGQRIVTPRLTLTPQVPLRSYFDSFGNIVWRWTAPPGRLRIHYDAVAAVWPLADLVYPELPGTPVDQLPDSVLMYTLPSRYCPSDLARDDAWRLFGEVPDGWVRVQAICDWVHRHIVYASGSSLNIPARYVYGYLPDINGPANPDPMDFHAWFEAYLGGAWQTFDARHNRPRSGRVVIARGRDAVDTAILTSYGDSHLTGLTVWAHALPKTGLPSELKA
jgi:transglutaminase-like putative cysteine protease